MKRLTNMRNRISFFIALPLFCFSTANAQQGKDGDKIITAANTVVNEYTQLTSDASVGSYSLTVTNSSLNTNNRFATPLSNGDFVMIIQMQGATIKGGVNDSTWGEVTNYNNSGKYEFANVLSVPNATTITLTCALTNSYSANGSAQVIRVPRFNSLTINSGGVLTADPWNGQKGGAGIVEVLNNTNIQSGGSIDVSNKGFRGGVLHNKTGGPQVNPNFASTVANDGGEKGEGIAGYDASYNTFGGGFCRGSAANGGGGGNSWNSPGGGGSNAGNVVAWTGNGNPDISTPSWATAWNLEYAGFANSTSSGGGRGGYSVAGSGADPLVNGPNEAIWSTTFKRSNTGGKGGRPLDYSTGRIFLGGGGGAGDEDNFNGGAGGKGGGLVYLLSYGTISGSGTINANGQNGGDVNSGGGSGDGTGGGGGGGAVVLYSTGAISGITVNANGGLGGTQHITIVESEGGAGGGGGGYIAISNGAITRQAIGGLNGTTTCPVMTNFPADGGTKGGDGMPNEVINSVPVSSVVINVGPNVAICGGATTTLSATGGGTYSWSPAATLSSSTLANPLVTPTGAGITSYTVVVTNNGCTGTAVTTVTVNPNPTPVISGKNSICFPENTTLTANGGGSYLWSNGETTAAITVSPTSSMSYSVTVTKSGCAGNTLDSVTVNTSPVTVAGVEQHIYLGQSVMLSGSGIGNYSWSPSAGLSCATCPNPTATPPQTTTYSLTITNASGCMDMDSVKVIVDADCGALFVPDAFSPNGDNFNDVFYARNPCIQEMSFNVYDRWGNKVFNSVDPQKGWDGTFKGKKMDSGVFIYYLSAKLYDGQQVTKKGNVTLMR